MLKTFVPRSVKAQEGTALSVPDCAFLNSSNGFKPRPSTKTFNHFEFVKPKLNFVNPWKILKMDNHE